MFKVFFNNKKQWLAVEIWDVHPTTFDRWNKTRWGYFQATWESPSSGEFGELHFVRSGIRFDTITHELIHVLAEWLYANRTSIISRNEERLAKMMDEIARKLEREFRRQGIKF